MLCCLFKSLYIFAPEIAKERKCILFSIITIIIQTTKGGCDEVMQIIKINS